MSLQTPNGSFLAPAGKKQTSPVVIPEGRDPVTIRAESGSHTVFIDDGTHDVEITLEPKSSVTYVSLLQSDTKQVSRTLRSEVGKEAKMHWQCITLGGKDDTHNLVSHCVGRHAVSQVDWIFLVQGQEKQTISVRNVFDAEQGEGEMTLQGVAEGKGYATCNGMIEITEKGKGTNTFLTETTLMLDPTAKVDAVPGLEIRTNDVKASHAATVRKVSEEDLFYFATRGIALPEARRMCVEGFLGALVQKFPEAIRGMILEEIARKYEKKLSPLFMAQEREQNALLP